MTTAIAGNHDDGAPVQLQLVRALPRNRLTVAFRLILVLPQLFVVAVLGFAAYFVVVAGWFSALVIGRTPTWVRDYVGFCLTWYARTVAYYQLVTDVYPPFTGHAPGHPVQLLLPPAGRLRRWSVFGRLVLAVPAFVISSALTSGVSLLVVFAWFAGVFAGRTPRAVFDAIATGLRYQLRLYAYLGLITPTYPWGPLGDGVEPKIYGGYPPGYPPAYPQPHPAQGYPPPYPPSQSAPTPKPPAPYPVPGAAPPYPPGQYPPAGYPPAGYPTTPYPPADGPSAGPSARPGWYDGVVSDGARVLLIVALVLGLLQTAGQATQFALNGGGSFGNFSRIGQAIGLINAGNDFDDAVSDASCPSGGQDCTGAVASSLLRAADRLGTYSTGSGGAAQRARLGTDLMTFETDVRAAAADESLVDASGEVVSTTVLEDQTTIDDDVTALQHALSR